MFIELLRKEIKAKEVDDFIGIGYDSDQEIATDSDDEYHSSDEIQERKRIKYDLDTMYDIIRKRDFNKWKLSTIHNRYKNVSLLSGRTQISR